MSTLSHKFLGWGAVIIITLSVGGCYSHNGHRYKLFSDRDTNPTDDLIIGEASDRGASHNARGGTTRSN
ncbi:hypothetical protein BH10PSE19_BH10PSE19_02690 [soil metagenome]